jgi:hypothetical protein
MSTLQTPRIFMKPISTAIGTAAIATLFTIPAFSQEVPTTLRQEMPYAEARQILLDAGWQANLLSPNRPRYSSAENYLIDELGYHEVAACSGTGLGFCRFEFTTADNQTLVVVTVNNDSEPTLYRWSLEETP